MTQRRALLLGTSAAGLLSGLGLPCAAESGPATATGGLKTLRYAFPVAETSMDPVKINDLYSRTLTAHIFEAPLAYDHLARPAKLKPLTAARLPEVSADFRVWTVTLRPGIYFADDPAFKGQRRELVAEDYVYTYKRYADPAHRSPGWTEVEGFGIVGLAALREAALQHKRPFDYDAEVPGLRALDRYTLRFELSEPRPRFDQKLAENDLYGAVAREVVNAYGDQIDAHPVGTGPFRLVQWRHGSRIVLERNPTYRPVTYDAEPAADDAEGQALLSRLKGRRLPMIDRVEIAIIEEQQPRWLSFLNGEADVIEKIGSDFVSLAMPGGHVAPNLARRGVRGYRMVEPATYATFFNMESPVVGGMAPAQVALRRAIGLAINTPREISTLRRGQAVPAQSVIAPQTSAFDPHYRSEMGQYDPARAKALLDIYGFADRRGTGWRDLPDGRPLKIELRSQADQSSRQIDGLLVKSLAAVGLRVELKVAQWPENLKAARAGDFTMWAVGSQADVPDSQSGLARLYSRTIGGQNMARFRLPAFDAVYEEMQRLPDGPQRAALFRRACELALAYMPYKVRLNRIVTDLAYPWVIGYRHSLFWQDWWQQIDIDDSQRPRA